MRSVTLFGLLFDSHVLFLLFPTALHYLQCILTHTIDLESGHGSTVIPRGEASCTCRSSHRTTSSHKLPALRICYPSLRCCCRYIPCVEDMVIGVVTDKHGEEYRLDIRSCRRERADRRGNGGAAREVEGEEGDAREREWGGWRAVCAARARGHARGWS
jgi:hypothetical protein